jgi:CBS domain containing-hemolysin-like protein
MRFRHRRLSNLNRATLYETMSTQLGLDTGKSKTSPSWLQRMAANLGFASAVSLRETLESAISETSEDEDKSLSPQERAMLLNVLGFGETRVAEVMIPRADIVAIEEDRSVAALFALFAEAGHSRVPVFRESLDNPVGMVHIKDAMAWATGNHAGPAAEDTPAATAGSIARLGFGSAKLNTAIAEAGLVREALFVPPSMPALTLLAKMKAKKIHLALVVDEFGGTDGIATFGDLVEAIIGDIEDEHDSAKAPSIGFENEAFVASARTPIEDVEQVLGISLAVKGVSGEVDTLGGLILAIAGSVPKRGQIVPHPSGVTFEILEAGPRRLHTVRISKQLALAPPDKPLLLAPPEGEQAGQPPSGQKPDLHGAKAA